ncbi:MAG: VOC family protein [Anaerolineales bacterium]
MGGTLPATMRLGPVHLKVGERDRSLRFYQDMLGLSVLQDSDEEIWLGTSAAPVLTLQVVPGAVPKPPGSTGLYHYALLLPNRERLGRALRTLVEAEYPLQGAADHLVSEAIYLADPDGNGIELYRDRPRESWPNDDGQVRMATDPLDVDGVLAAGADEDGPALPAGTQTGHVHLHVADLGEAERFYGDVLGFDLVTRYGRQAAFYSVGGYHHHIGLNTWAGEGAPPPPDNAVGLAYFTMFLENASELGAVADRVAEAGMKAEVASGSLFLVDPSGNRMQWGLQSNQDLP